MAENIFDIKINSVWFDLSKALVESWLSLYRKNKGLTIAATILILAVITTTVTLLIMRANKEAELARQKAELARQENATYEKQLELLSNTGTNLKNLIEFVELEKQRLQQSEKALNNLKNEEQLLKPIVQSDRKTVEALLDLQNQRAQETLTKERLYAFGFGILTSLIASFLIAVGRFAYKYSNRKNATKKPEPGIES